MWVKNSEVESCEIFILRCFHTRKCMMNFILFNCRLNCINFNQTSNKLDIQFIQIALLYMYFSFQQQVHLCMYVYACMYKCCDC